MDKLNSLYEDALRKIADDYGKKSGFENYVFSFIQGMKRIGSPNVPWYVSRALGERSITKHEAKELLKNV